ncbi:MAG: A/G-specific adenine glycosylase [Spirochaetia bacterium]|jgi:A/G-specific adenine glycosylase
MPWRRTRVSYRIFVSEIILQQTRIDRVRRKYPEFLRAFPSFRRLAEASVEQVLAAWKGLGYNRRALALRESARIIVTRHRGRVPRTVTGLMELPGVGHATASAVLVYSFNMPLAFIETNIRRVYLHFFFPRSTDVTDKMILPLIEKTMDRSNPREWFYALMDYGAMLGRKEANPNRRSAGYKRQPAFQGSVRQARGEALAAMLKLRNATEKELARAIGGPDSRLRVALCQLVEEGFLSLRGRRYYFR